MDSLRFLSDKELIEAYKKACKFSLSREFIDILREELLERSRTPKEIQNYPTDSERVLE
ncbi:sporulation histidine kinase inhibitor Sda [Falsibacillus pallidus]|uniref:sporulation histidine kinase inhibitor Sda n=1 Tax=Falsibacillus pallidus TaxID=493781 RepID=UPI003D9A0567